MKDAPGRRAHVWRLTRLAVIFNKHQTTKRIFGLILLDKHDPVIQMGLVKLMTKVDDRLPGKDGVHVALGEFLSEASYIVAYNWGALLEEAEMHIQTLARGILASLI